MAPIRRTAALPLVLVSVLSLQGCGQKGALYREAPVEDTPAAENAKADAGNHRETRERAR